MPVELFIVFPVKFIIEIIIFTSRNHDKFLDFNMLKINQQTINQQHPIYQY